MATKSTKTKGNAKGKSGKLQLKKETLKDLSASQKAMKKVKGGRTACAGNTCTFF